MKSINQSEKRKTFFLSQKENSKKRGKILVLRVCNTEVSPQLGSLALLDTPVMADARQDITFPPAQSFPLGVYTSNMSALDIPTLGHCKNILHAIYS